MQRYNLMDPFEPKHLVCMGGTHMMPSQSRGKVAQDLQEAKI